MQALHPQHLLLSSAAAAAGGAASSSSSAAAAAATAAVCLFFEKRVYRVLWAGIAAGGCKGGMDIFAIVNFLCREESIRAR